MVRKKSEPNPADEIVDISDEREWEQSRARRASSPTRPQKEKTNGDEESASSGPAAAVIVAVEADAKRPAMYKLAIAVEGQAEQALIGVHEDTLVAWRLLKDRRLSPEEWEMLRKEQEKEEAYRSALYMLDFKARTQAELRRGLVRKRVCGRGDRRLPGAPRQARLRERRHVRAALRRAARHGAKEREPPGPSGAHAARRRQAGDR
ncbi:hypothetical protein [Cohnella ginsengisoli]|uniref:hypothetical protein n=1 Tax=Cohnella ginsengisoli TaxID=425004 RepID=UPI003B8A6FE2